MPRQKNTRPTNIYWLYDIRPETIAVFGPEGHPFYCGKTVYDIEFRLRNHRYSAVSHPHRLISTNLAPLGEHVHVELKEIVSLEDDWVAREQYWIEVLRTLNPHCANVSRGGQGNPGFVPGSETRRKMRNAKLGRKFSLEHRAKMSAGQLRRQSYPVCSAEQRIKLKDAWVKRRTRPISEETRTKMRIAKLGKKFPNRQGRGKGHSPSIETRAKIGAAHMGKIVSETTRAKLRDAALRHWERING